MNFDIQKHHLQKEFFIKDNSINSNDNNFTKTDIDSNINNSNTVIIIKHLAINENLTKKNYINIKLFVHKIIL